MCFLAYILELYGLAKVGADAYLVVVDTLIQYFAEGDCIRVEGQAKLGRRAVGGRGDGGRCLVGGGDGVAGRGGDGVAGQVVDGALFYVQQQGGSQAGHRLLLCVGQLDGYAGGVGGGVQGRAVQSNAVAAVGDGQPCRVDTGGIHRLIKGHRQHASQHVDCTGDKQRAVRVISCSREAVQRNLVEGDRIARSIVYGGRIDVEQRAVHIRRLLQLPRGQRDGQYVAADGPGEGGYVESLGAVRRDYLYCAAVRDDGLVECDGYHGAVHDSQDRDRFVRVRGGGDHEMAERILVDGMGIVHDEHPRP